MVIFYPLSLRGAHSPPHSRISNTFDTFADDRKEDGESFRRFIAEKGWLVEEDHRADEAEFLLFDPASGGEQVS